jgi:hypothetical protein
MTEPEKVDVSQPFVRWILVRFLAREYFVMFLALLIMGLTAHFVWRDKPIPEGWWGMVGVVIGYYFRGGSCGKE